MEFYLKNEYKRLFSSSEANQDPQANNICNLNKTLAKPTYNIKTKTNNTTLVVKPKLTLKQFYFNCSTKTTSYSFLDFKVILICETQESKYEQKPQQTPCITRTTKHNKIMVCFKIQKTRF
jgi:hypothetical protein